MLDADPVVLCEVVLAESVSAWRYDLFIAGCWFDFCGARNCVIVFVVRWAAFFPWFAGSCGVLVVVVSKFVCGTLR